MASPDFWDDFVRTAKLAPGVWDEVMQRYGGRGGQHRVLWVLWETDGRTPIEIARSLGIAAPTVVKMASHMAASGLLTRRRDAHDRRRVHLHLTPRGKALQAPIEAAMRRFRRQMSAGLTVQERRFLASAFSKMVRNVERIPRGAAPEPPVG